MEATGTVIGTESRTYPENKRLAPCRQAARCVTRCPQCDKSMTIKSLRYSHVCEQTANGSRDIANLAMGMEQTTVIDFGARIHNASDEHARERIMEQQRAKWTHLTGFDCDDIITDRRT